MSRADRTRSGTPITPICAAPDRPARRSQPRRTAGMCGFSLVFSITRRAAVDRRGPMLAAHSRGVTGLRVAAGAQMPVDVRANVPAAGSRILPDRTRAACGMSGRTAGQVIRGDLTRAALSARARPIRQPVTVPRHVSGRSADARRRRLRQSAGHLQADAPDVLAPAAPSGTEPPARNARCVAENSPWHVSQAHRSSLGNRSPCTQPATRCGGKPKFPKGSTDFDAERLGKNLGRGVESTRVRSWRR